MVSQGLQARIVDPKGVPARVQHGLRVPRVYQHVSNMVCVSQGCTSTCPTWSACPKGVPARVQHGPQHAVYTWIPRVYQHVSNMVCSMLCIPGSQGCTSTCPTWSAACCVYLCPKDVPACVQHGLQHAVYTWMPREYQHVSNMVCSMLCIPVSQGCTSTCPTWSAACCVYLDPKGVPARVQHVSNMVCSMLCITGSQGCTSTCPTRVQHGLQHAVYTCVPRMYQHVSNIDMVIRTFLKISSEAHKLARNKNNIQNTRVLLILLFFVHCERSIAFFGR